MSDSVLPITIGSSSIGSVPSVVSGAEVVDVVSSEPPSSAGAAVVVVVSSSASPSPHAATTSAMTTNRTSQTELRCVRRMIPSRMWPHHSTGQSLQTIELAVEEPVKRGRRFDPSRPRCGVTDPSIPEECRPVWRSGSIPSSG